MNREQAKELCPIVQAFGEGKTIQNNLHSHVEEEWMDGGDDMEFNMPPENYRIKPEPRVIYVNMYNDNHGSFVHGTAEQAREAVDEVVEGMEPAVKFIEVIE